MIEELALGLEERETVSWEGITFRLVGQGIPISHQIISDSTTSRLSVWHALDLHTTGCRRSTLWFSVDAVSGYVMAGDGLEGDSFSLNRKREDKRFFRDYWRNCLLFNPRSINEITVFSLWEREYLLRQPSYGDPNFHVHIRRNMWSSVREQKSVWGDDYKLAAHNLFYYSVSSPPAFRVNRNALVVG